WGSGQMRMIYKYKLELDDEVEIWMPNGAKILSVGFQKHLSVQSTIQLWAMVNPNQDPNDREKRTFRIIGTGHLIGDYGKLNFIGTLTDNLLVWHVFEKMEK
ncbi:MAG: DUF7352 domain-containing protein, partial [Candidatus Hodarchaeales archaeon]